jgi:Reverse transcriptase (RNA-dependent DNA polymerase)
MEKEYNDLKRRGTFKIIPKEETSNKQILLLKWVFKYKFDSDGYLQKLKAQLCVRGDLQITKEEIYAATLAARIFRALIAIAAAFDLEIQQYNAVNTFTNAKLSKPVYCYCLKGFGQDGYILELLMALYRLKISPLL